MHACMYVCTDKQKQRYTTYKIIYMYMNAYIFLRWFQVSMNVCLYVYVYIYIYIYIRSIYSLYECT